MFRVLLACVSLLAVFLADSSRPLSAGGVKLPDLKVCPEPGIQLKLLAREEALWSKCEKWVWSCIVSGKEANLFVKKCTTARPDGDNPDRLARWKNKFAPFFSPDRYKDYNGVRSEFVAALLSNDFYSRQIPAVGIRIFGGYFEQSLNLENVTTDKNLVIDGSIFKRGVRMTNFHTSKNVSFDRSNVRGRMLLMRARIGGSLFLEHGVFDRVDARDARIRASLEASRSVFNDIFRFDRALVEGKVHFVNSRLTALSGWEASIGGLIELRRADVRVWIDLSGASVSGDVRFQKVTFGRRVVYGRYLSELGATPVCDWDPTAKVENVLTQLYELASSKGLDQASSLMDEIVGSRPTAKGAKTEPICDEAARKSDFDARREVMLRDMKIGGTLCVMDTTGAVPSVLSANGVFQELSGDSDGSWIERISLDGTQANSTVLRWKSAQDSKTLWRAVNYNTGHMLLGVDEHPSRHFFDNWEVARVAFVKRPRKISDGSEVEASGNDEDDNRGLCDVTPRQKTLAPPDLRETQNRVAALFSGAANESESFQPFAKFVSLLSASGVNTTHMKIKLSEYKNRNACTASIFTKRFLEARKLDWARKDESWGGVWKRMRYAWNTAPISGFSETMEESRKLGLDVMCMGWLPISYFATSYGHEPTNLFYIFVLFVGTFWIVLKFDKEPRHNMVLAPHLGFLYALDTFIPLGQLRFNDVAARYKPIRRSLRVWLVIHRLVGLVVCIAIFVLVFKAV